MQRKEKNMENNSENRFLDNYKQAILENLKELYYDGMNRQKLEENQLDLDLFDENKEIIKSDKNVKGNVNNTFNKLYEEKKKIRSVIQKLSEENFSKNKYKNIKNILDELNQDEDFRYDYYDIYVNVSEIAEKEPLKLNYLTANTEELNKRLYKAANYKRIDKKYSKFIQYIKLEAVRSYNDIEKRKKIDEENEKIKNDLIKTKTQLDTAKRKLARQQFDMLAVLGVFSAIILAFTGGLNFSSSVLESMNSASIYRVLLVSILLAFTLVNGIAILLKFIKNINKDDNEETNKIEQIGFFKAVRNRFMSSYIVKFNVMVFILLFVVLCALFNDSLGIENKLNEKLRAIESGNVKVVDKILEKDEIDTNTREEDNNEKKDVKVKEKDNKK